MTKVLFGESGIWRKWNLAKVEYGESGIRRKWKFEFPLGEIPLDESGIRYVLFSEVESNPTVNVVNRIQ